MMAARLDSVARYVCEKGGWRVSNLQLQKLIYMAQMVYMGENDGARLVDASFQAWDYGPVIPELYSKVRMFGSGPIKDVFFLARPFRDEDRRKLTLDEACDNLLDKRPGELVDITHWSEGAWSKHYVQGVKGIEIPDRDILAEYRARAKQ